MKYGEIKEVKVVFSVKEVNTYLAEGWALLKVFCDPQYPTRWIVGRKAK